MENTAGGRSWRIWAGLLVLFLSGLLIGFLAGGIAEKRLTARALDAGSANRTRLIMKRLNSMLHLTDEQQAEVKKIVIESQAKLRRLWMSQAPQVSEIFEHGYTSIRKILTPAQRKKYDQYIEKKKKQWTLMKSRYYKNQEGTGK